MSEENDFETYEKLLRPFTSKEVKESTCGIFKYPASFIPQYSRYIIEKYSKKNDFVLDPFCGGGTTLVEANLLGRNSYGLDLSPLARLVTEIATTPIDPSDLKKIRIDIDFNNSKKHTEYKYCKIFEKYMPKTSIQYLTYVKSQIERIEDTKIRSFFLVTLLSIVRKCSFISQRSFNLVPSRLKAYRVSEGGLDIEKTFKKQIKKNIARMNHFYTHCDKTVVSSLVGSDAKSIPLDNDSIDLVVTSPPYISTVSYIETQYLELLLADLVEPSEYSALKKTFLGEISDKKSKYRHLNVIGIDKIDEIIKNLFEKDKVSSYSAYLYFKNLLVILNEIKRVTKESAKIGLILEENTIICRILIPLCECICEIMRILGFSKEVDIRRKNSDSETLDIDRIVLFTLQ